MNVKIVAIIPYLNLCENVFIEKTRKNFGLVFFDMCSRRYMYSVIKHDRKIFCERFGSEQSKYPLSGPSVDVLRNSSYVRKYMQNSNFQFVDKFADRVVDDSLKSFTQLGLLACFFSICSSPLPNSVSIRWSGTVYL